MLACASLILPFSVSASVSVSVFVLQFIATAAPLVLIICPDELRDAWYTAHLETSTGTLSEVTQRSLLPSPDTSKCFILATTSLSYSSTTGQSEREGYVSTQYSKVGTTSLGAWEDVLVAVRVMGVSSFASYFSFVPGSDEFFVTVASQFTIDDDSSSFLVSYFAGVSAPDRYEMFAAPLTDGANAIVLGIYQSTLPILGKISKIVTLQGTLMSTSLYQIMISVDSCNVLSHMHMYRPLKTKVE